jgi:hypothetical protein
VGDHKKPEDVSVSGVHMYAYCIGPHSRPTCLARGVDILGQTGYPN